MNKINKLILVAGMVVAVFFIHQNTYSLSPVNPDGNPNLYCAYTNVNSNLWYGNWGNNKKEVLTVQNYLFNYYGISGEVNATGFFGRLTKQYVVKFQRDFNLNATGGVGPLTRGKMKELCGNNIPQDNSQNTAPVIKSFTGPVKLNINEKGTWKIDASVYNNQSLSYNVTWGDEVNYDIYKMSQAPAFMNSVIVQNTTFEHTYSRAGTFTITIEVKAENGQTAKTTQTVTVLQNNIYGKCLDGGQYYDEGAKLTCRNTGGGAYGPCIADAYFVCRNGEWKVEGGLTVNIGTGTLYGKVSIGPICSVETNPPQPNCLPNYVNDPIAIYQANKITFVQNVIADVNGNFSVQLPPGTYWVRVPSREPNCGGYGRDQYCTNFMPVGSISGAPTMIEIIKDKRVNLNINIDTGIR